MALRLSKKEKKAEVTLTRDEELCLAVMGRMPIKVEKVVCGKPAFEYEDGNVFIPRKPTKTFEPFSLVKNNPEVLQQRHDKQEKRSHLCTDYEFGKLIACCEDLRQEYLASTIFLNKEFHDNPAEKIFDDDAPYAPHIKKERVLTAAQLIQSRVLDTVYGYIRENFSDIAKFEDVQDCFQMLAENRYPGNMAKVSMLVRHYGEFVAPASKQGPRIDRETIRDYFNFHAGSPITDPKHHDAKIGLKADKIIFFTPKQVRTNLNDVDAEYAYKAFNAGSYVQFDRNHNNPFGFCHKNVATKLDVFNKRLTEDLDATVEYFAKKDRKKARDSTFARMDDILNCASLPLTLGLGVAYDQQINLVVQILSYSLFRIWHYEILIKTKRQTKVKAQAANVWAQAQANKQSIQETKKFIIRRRKLEDVAASVQWTVDQQTDHIEATNRTLPKRRIEGLRAALEKRLVESRAGLARNFVSQVVRDLVPSLVKAHRSHSPAIRPNIVIVRNHNSHGVGRSVVLQRGGIPSSVPK